MSSYRDEVNIPLYSSRDRDESPRRTRPSWRAERTFRHLLRPRVLLFVLKVVVPAVILSIIVGLYYWEPHVEIAFYNRAWVSQEVLAVPPLAGCFSRSRISPSYNVTDALYGPKYTEVHAGISMRFGMDCYDFAGTIPSLLRVSPREQIPPEERV